MEQKKTNVAVIVLAVGGLLAFSLFALAGNRDPCAPPGPTMHTLDEIYNELTSGIAQREGYFERVSLTNSGPTVQQDLFTVTSGKRFVLLQLYYDGGTGDTWSLQVDSNTILDGTILHSGVEASIGNVCDYHLNFPDRTFVVNSGQTLTLALNSGGTKTWYVVGYFYDVQ